MLTTIMCFGFSSYVVLSHHNVVKEISIGHVEDESEAKEKSVTEINSLYIHEDLSHHNFLISSLKTAYHINNDQLPDFHLMVNTPPPDLA